MRPMWQVWRADYPASTPELADWHACNRRGGRIRCRPPAKVPDDLLRKQAALAAQAATDARKGVERHAVELLTAGQPEATTP